MTSLERYLLKPMVRVCIWTNVLFLPNFHLLKPFTNKARNCAKVCCRTVRVALNRLALQAMQILADQSKPPTNMHVQCMTDSSGGGIGQPSKCFLRTFAHATNLLSKKSLHCVSFFLLFHQTGSCVQEETLSKRGSETALHLIVFDT